MNRKFVTVKSYRLAYAEVNPAADKIIFFLHGNSSSADLWRLQLTDKNFSGYRLIAFDLPGHGLSDHSSNADDDYSLPGTAAIIREAIQSLVGMHPYMITGFSSGANIASELLACSIVPVGIALIGACVLGGIYDFGTVFKMQEIPSILTYNEKDEKKVDSFINNHIQSFDKLLGQQVQKDYTAVDLAYKPALFGSAAKGNINDEVQLLKDYGLEVCVIFGADDSLINTNYLDKQPFYTWRQEVFKVAGAGHWVQLEKPAVVNSLILQYADERFQQLR